LGYTALHAPFAGIVTARMADPGTLAAPGIPLLQIDRDGPLQVYTTVDESLIGTVRMGMKVPVSIEASIPQNSPGPLPRLCPRPIQRAAASSSSSTCPQ